MSWKYLKSNLLLWLVPALLPVLAVLFCNWLGEFDADPNYAYLLNSLGLLYLHPPYLYSHPGTPVQLVCALLIGLIWLVRLPWLGVSPQTDVLAHPELYLWWINLIFVMMGAAAIHFLGRQLRAVTGSLMVAIVAQLSFLLSVPLLTAAIVSVDPEGLFVSLTALLAAIEAPFVFSASPRASRLQDGAMVGTLIGACIATKVTAIPLVLTTLFLRDRRVILASLIAAGAAVIVFTLPIASHYTEIARNMLGILVHSGHYGGGDVGMPSWATLRQNALVVFMEMPEMFVTLAAAAALGIIGVGALAPQASFRRLFLVCASVLALALAMLIKHPGGRYVVPAVATMAFANAGLAYAIVPMKHWRRIAVAAIGSALMALGLSRGVSQSLAETAKDGASRQADLAFLKTYAGEDRGCTRVYIYDAQAIPYKLLFGNIFADGYFNRPLAEIYPDFISYNPSRHAFETFGNGLLEPAEADRILARAPCARLVGSHLERFDDFGIPPEFMSLRAQALSDVISMAVYDLRLPVRPLPLK